jgi:hypothetical protein
VLVLDMIKILPSLENYKYDTGRILPMKCYIDNSVRLRSCIRNVNSRHLKSLFSTITRNQGTGILDDNKMK